MDLPCGQTTGAEKTPSLKLKGLQEVFRARPRLVEIGILEIEGSRPNLGSFKIAPA